VSLGLENSDVSDAHSSKKTYVRKRLEKQPESRLLDIATEIEDKFPNFELLEFFRRPKDQNGPQISDLTRRALVSVLDSYAPFGDLHLVEELNKLWPLASLPSQNLRRNLEESVYQHCIRNPEDCSTSYLLDQLDIVGCSRTLFFLFLEPTVSPNARRDESQRVLVAALNQHLKVDGYHFQMTGTISGYPVFKILPVSGGVTGAPKNLIFAAIGAKPEIVLSDAINNDLKIVKNADKCLVYDRPLGNVGLFKLQMIEWWRDRENISDGNRS